MTIRWGESELRFRISGAELAQLRAGQALSERLDLSPWAFELRPGPENSLAATSECLTLRVAPEVLGQLAEGRSLDTITQAETLSPFSAGLGGDYDRYTAAVPRWIGLRQGTAP